MEVKKDFPQVSASALSKLDHLEINNLRWLKCEAHLNFGSSFSPR
jgi:hypothetical protein